MDDDDRKLTTKEGAVEFDISTGVLCNRAKLMAGHPQPVRDERLGRVFWRLAELQQFSREYHARQTSRCLFSPRRLMELTPEEREIWGVVVHPWQKEKPAA